LRVSHPEARDLGTLLHGWGFEVRRKWQTGDPRQTPKGDALEGVRTSSYAYVEVELPARGDVAEALGLILDRLERAKAEAQEFANDGGRVELFVQWHFDGNSGGTFDWQLLQRLSDHRIDLSLDIYPEGEWLTSEPEEELAKGRSNGEA
jgi:hypothetical protein